MAEITMPKLSDTMTEGTLVSWKKQRGDKVSSGDVIAEVETDKATMEMEAFEDGVLSEIYVQEGTKVAVGEKIAAIQGKGETAPATAVPAAKTTPAAAASRPTKAAVPAESAPAVAGSSEIAEAAGVADATDAELGRTPASAANGSHGDTAADLSRVKASPLAKKVALAQGISLGGLVGSGPGGRIIQRDVLAAAPNPGGHAKTSPVAPAPVAPKPVLAPATSPVMAAPVKPPGLPQKETRIPLNGMRRTIAERLLQSKTTIPHFYLHVEVDAGPLAKLRTENNAAGEKDGTKVSFNDLILKATATALSKVPKVNAAFAGDAITEFSSVNLSVAVAVEDGLVTPVIRDAHTKSLSEISLAVKDFAVRARSKKLKPEEYQGGTFTVSNLGSYGIDSFDAIINVPQAASLSVGALVKKPVVNAAGEIVVGQCIDLGLSCDHRVVDGALGAQFLAALRKLIESPVLMLL